MKRFLKASWNKIKAAGRKVRSLFTKRRIWQAAYFTATVGVTAYLLVYMLPLWLAVLVLGVVVLHEFGHYFTGLKRGREVSLPFFIPAVWFVLGGTKIKGDETDPEGTMKIALAGPTVGLVICAGGMITGAVMGFWPLFWASFWLGLFQVYNGTFGSDGRRYRRARSVVEANREFDLEVASARPLVVV